jgi:hypothetical protein
MISTQSVQLGLSPFCQATILDAKYIYKNIDASLRGVVDKRAIKSSGEECQTHHCQPHSTNIGHTFKTKKNEDEE